MTVSLGIPQVTGPGLQALSGALYVSFGWLVGHEPLAFTVDRLNTICVDLANRIRSMAFTLLDCARSSRTSRREDGDEGAAISSLHVSSTLTVSLSSFTSPLRRK